MLRLTKMCAPKCLDFERVQVGRDEMQCLDNCVKGLHNVNEATMHFFRDLESDMTQKQTSLIEEMAQEQALEKSNAKKTQRE